MNRVMNVLVPMIALAAIAVLTQPATASSITPIGVETGYGDGWRDGSAKPAIGGQATDPNTDGMWGSDGYYLFDGSATGGAIQSLPTTGYISAVTQPAGTTLLASGAHIYGTIDDPTKTLPTVTTMYAGGLYSGSGGLQPLGTLTIGGTGPVDFVLTVISGSVYFYNSTPQITVAQVVGGGASATASTGEDPTGNYNTVRPATYNFFRITANPGDQFQVSGLNNTSYHWPLDPEGATRDAPWAGIVGFGFEAEPTPEPGTLVLLATGLIGLLAYAWRKRR